MDDLFIKATSIQHMTEILNILLKDSTKNNLTWNPDKCWYYCTLIPYIGLIISTAEIKINFNKIFNMLEWKRPVAIKEDYTNILSFNGLMNFYRGFCPNLAKTLEIL